MADDLVPDLRDLLAARRPRLVLAPQAIGGHVDHVQLLAALDCVAVDAPTLWWRDFPYTVREAAPRAPRAARFADLPEVDVALDAGAQARKRLACAAYASQVGFQFGGAAGLARRLDAEGARERFRLTGPLPDGVQGALAA